MNQDPSLSKFISELFSKNPTPGGGGAAAVNGALGVSLLAMVSNLSVNKKSLAEHQSEHQQLLEVFERNKNQFIDLIDADEKAFSLVMDGYQKKKSGEIDEEQMHTLCIEAARVPLKCLSLAVATLPHAIRLSEIGNKNLFSDISCGVYHLSGCYQSSLVNVSVNLRGREDHEKSKELISEVARQKAFYGKFEKSIELFLKSQLIDFEDQ